MTNGFNHCWINSVVYLMSTQILSGATFEQTPALNTIERAQNGVQPVPPSTAWDLALWMEFRSGVELAQWNGADVSEECLLP